MEPDDELPWPDDAWDWAQQQQDQERWLAEENAGRELEMWMQDLRQGSSRQ